jgi:ketopantoate reductase
VTLQNGVDAEAIARRMLPHASVLPGVVYVASSRVATGRIQQSSRFFRLAFGTTDGRAPPGAHVLAGVCQRAYPNGRRHIWRRDVIEDL